MPIGFLKLSTVIRKKPRPCPEQFLKIPTELKKYSNWVLWKFELRNGHKTKVPYQINGRKADVSNPATWSEFSLVVDAFQQGSWDGIGFVFSENDPFVGVDLDDCFSSKRLQPWSPEQRKMLPAGFPDPKEIVNTLGYVELSPSETGVKCFGIGELTGGSRHVGDFEVYDRARFFTVTGRKLKNVSDQLHAVDKPLAALISQLPPRTNGAGNVGDLDFTKTHPLKISDERIIQKLKANLDALNVWSAGKREYSSDSEADLALANHVAYYVGPYPTIIDRILRASKRVRDKWNRKDTHGSFSMTRLVLPALANRDSFFPWKVSSGNRKITNTSKTTIPQELLTVPGFVDDVLNFTLKTSHCLQPALAIAGALSLLSVLIGNRVVCEQGRHTNLYFLAVARTGRGKDRPRKVNKEVLTATGALDMLACENPASDAGLLRALEEQPVQLCQPDEFGRFLVAAKTRDSHLYRFVTELLKLYSHAGEVYTGKKYASSKNDITIHHPCLSLFAATTPDTLFEAIGEDSIRDGFLPRLIIFEGDDDPHRPDFVKKLNVPRSVIDQAVTYLEIGGGHTDSDDFTPRILQYSPAAKKVFAELRDYCVEQTRGGGLADDIWTRQAEKAASLALLHALSRDPAAATLDQEAMQWASGLVKFLGHRLAEIVDRWCASSLFDKRQKAFMRKLEQRNGFMTQNQATRCSQHLRPRERDELFNNLMETGQIEELQVSVKKTMASLLYDPTKWKPKQLKSHYSSSKEES